jgi:hypothetical protein
MNTTSVALQPTSTPVGLSKGAEVGIGIGIAVGLAIVGVLVFFIMKQWPKPISKPDSTEYQPEMGTNATETQELDSEVPASELPTRWSAHELQARWPTQELDGRGLEHTLPHPVR